MNVGRSNILINKTVQIAAYADDINIMSRTTTRAQETYTSLKKNASAIGPEINREKTKILTQTRSNKNQRKVTLEDNIQVR